MTAVEPSNDAPAMEDNGGIMSSIAAVRELLTQKELSSADASLKDKISELEQSRYEDRVQLEAQIRDKKDLMDKLKRKLERAVQEAQREKSLRLTLEKANEAFEEHKKELLAQLELVSKSRASIEETVIGFRSSMEEEKVSFQEEKDRLEATIKDLSLKNEEELKRTGLWEARFLASERRAEEFSSGVTSLKKQMESARIRHQETIQEYAKSTENLKKRLEESDKARKLSSASEEIREDSSTETDLQSRLVASERQVKILKAQNLTIETQMRGKLMGHAGTIQELVKAREDMGRRLEDEEQSRKTADEKVSSELRCT